MTKDTAASVVSYVDEMFPNNVSAALKYTMLNDILRDIKTFAMSTGYSPATTTDASCITLTSGVSLYSLPTDVDIEDIKKFMVNNSTGAYTSTSIGTSYSYVGLNDDYNGNNYYDGLNGYFGIYPVPTSDETGKIVRLRYQLAPTVYTTTNSTGTLDIDPDYTELVKSRLISKVAKTGDFPDIDMANNWEYESVEMNRNIRLKRNQKIQKTRGNKISYRDWEW